MHIVWNCELRKFAIGMLAVMAVSLLGVNMGMMIYVDCVRAEYNDFLAAVFGNVREAYPDVTEEELVRVLEGHGNETTGEVVLARYGILGEYGSDSFGRKGSCFFCVHAPISACFWYFLRWASGYANTWKNDRKEFLA